MWTSDNEIWLRTSQELFSERGARYFDKSIEYVYVFTNSLEYSDYTETFLLEDETVVYSTENVNFFPMSFQHFDMKKTKGIFFSASSVFCFQMNHFLFLLRLSIWAQTEEKLENKSLKIYDSTEVNGEIIAYYYVYWGRESIRQKVRKYFLRLCSLQSTS